MPANIVKKPRLEKWDLVRNLVAKHKINYTNFT